MCSILIIDDEKMTREGIKENIDWNSLGIQRVELAEDGAKALELIKRSSFDILLCDVRMPRMNGIQLASIVTEMYPHTQIIFLSGYMDKEYLKSAIKMKAVDYVEKPAPLDELTSSIEKAMELSLRQKEQLQKEIEMAVFLQENSQEAIERLLLKLVARPPVALDELQSELMSTHTRFPPHGRFTVVNFDFHFSLHFPYGIQLLHKRKILTVLHSRFHSIRHCYIAGFKENQRMTWIVHDEVNGICPITPLLLEELRKQLAVEINGPVTVGVGLTVRGIENLAVSYQTAVRSVEKSFFYGIDRVIMHREDNGETYQPDPNIHRKFQDLLYRKQYDACIQIINLLADEIRSCVQTDVPYIKHLFFSLLVPLSQLAEGTEASLEEPKKDNHYFWEQFLSLYTLEQIHGYLIDFVRSLSNDVKNNKEISSGVYETVQYIRKHYDRDLTVRDVAQHIHLSPTYLCSIFKKETGQTIHQYMTEVRIQKSLGLLKERSYKLYEVAQKVGFCSENYFAKVFKKMTGCNPSEYRERRKL